MAIKIAPFIIMALPRSRTAWLAHWLAYAGKFTIGHDLLIGAKSVANYISWFELGIHGTCETAAMMGWRLLQHEIQDIKIILIRRDFRESLKSMARFGLIGSEIEQEIEIRDALLDFIETQPGVVSYKYNDLKDPSVCAELWEHCLSIPFDLEWWKHMNGINVQINMEQRIKLLIQNHSQIESLKAEVNNKLLELGGQQCLQLN